MQLLEYYVACIFAIQHGDYSYILQVHI